MICIWVAPGKLNQALAGEDLIGLAVERGTHAAWKFDANVGHTARHAGGLTVIEVHDGDLANALWKEARSGRWVGDVGMGGRGAPVLGGNRWSGTLTHRSRRERFRLSGR